MTWLSLCVVLFGTACREKTIYGPAPGPLAGTTGAQAAGAGGAGPIAGASGAGPIAGASGAGPIAGASGAGPVAGSAAPTSAVALLTGFMGGTVTGTATFTKGAGTDVTVNVALMNCVNGKAYPVHIHAGTSCADAMMQGDHWGPARGEGIPNVNCVGTTGVSMLTRPATDPMLAWSIGGDPATNVIGHAFVVHAPDMPMNPARIACGVITAR